MLQSNETSQGIAAKDIRIVDKAGDVAGTWYWNRYPGAMCDVEAPVYMPLCEEIGYTFGLPIRAVLGGSVPGRRRARKCNHKRIRRKYRTN